MKSSFRAMLNDYPSKTMGATNSCGLKVLQTHRQYRQGCAEIGIWIGVGRRFEGSVGSSVFVGQEKRRVPGSTESGWLSECNNRWVLG